MHILIDAQNFLYSVPSYRQILAKSFISATNHLIHDLSQYRDWSDDEITLVFDGPGMKELHMVPSLELIFSGELSSADSVIEKMIGQSSVKKNFMVVTSDHSIEELVNALGARCLSPLLFMKIMDHEISEKKNRYRKFLK